jgi:tRNA-specific 2-thiouridylase
MIKVAIAMSGGVDSSVAAALAVDKYGKENVFGLTMKLFCYGEDSATEKSCCSLDAINDAAVVCKQIGIPHYVVNLEKEFQAEIIDNFVSEYEQGRTPNPCVRCNSLIKFRYLLAKAQELGADLLVTGHYARIAPSVIPGRKPGTQPVLGLFRGLDVVKDQSYFLYNLNQEQLAHIWFPLGELTKPETRKLAEKYALKTAGKSESQDICFVTTSTQDFLSNKLTAKPGNIVDTSGKIYGKHEGLPFYTIGQRKGLGGGFSEPMYVIGLDMAKNELIVGREDGLFSNEMLVGEVTWTKEAPTFPAKIDVKIRYNSEAAAATLSVISTEAEKSRSLGYARDDILIQFQLPQKAITPGQTAVFYLGDEVVGGGIIKVL